MPTHPKKPITASEIPASFSQADKVEKTRRKGSPAENPKNSMPITRGFL